MKKTLVSLLSVLFIFGIFLSPVSASSQTNKENTLNQVKALTEKTPGLEMVDVNELPEGTKFIKFDSVEDFEKAVQNYERYHKDTLKAQAGDSQGNSTINGGITTGISPMATALGNVQWVAYKWYDLNTPLTMGINFNYSYTGSGSSKLFTGVSNINSWGSPSYPSSWHQTNKTGNLIDGRRTIELSISGYHLFGAEIAGFPIGYKSYASYTKYYYR